MASTKFPMAASDGRGGGWPQISLRLLNQYVRRAAGISLCRLAVPAKIQRLRLVASECEATIEDSAEDRASRLSQQGQILC